MQDSGSTGNPLKVKPSYQSCKDCLRLPQGRRCDRPAGGRSHRLNPSRHCTVPTICIDPPGTSFASSPLLHSLQTPAAVPPHLAQPCGSLYRCNACGPTVPPVPVSSCPKLVSPMSCEETPLAGSSEGMGEPQGEDMGEQVCREGAVELEMQTPRLEMDFGVELMQQRAVGDQLPAGPLP